MFSVGKPGRPKIKDPRIHRYCLRMNDSEWVHMQRLYDQGVNVAELLRTTIIKTSKGED